MFTCFLIHIEEWTQARLKPRITQTHEVEWNGICCLRCMETNLGLIGFIKIWPKFRHPINGLLNIHDSY